MGKNLFAQPAESQFSQEIIRKLLSFSELSFQLKVHHIQMQNQKEQRQHEAGGGQDRDFAPASLSCWQCDIVQLLLFSMALPYLPPSVYFPLLALFESREFLIPCVSAVCNCSRCYGDIIETNSSSATQLIPSAHSFARLHTLVIRQLRDCSIKQ